MFGRKARELTPQQIAFLTALRNPETKGDLRTALTEAGYSKTMSVSDICKSLKDEIIEVAKEILAANAAKASWAIVGAIDDANPMTAIMTQNAERILDRVGIVKGEKLTVDNGPNRIAILPRRKDE